MTDVPDRLAALAERLLRFTGEAFLLHRAVVDIADGLDEETCGLDDGKVLQRDLYDIAKALEDVAGNVEWLFQRLWEMGECPRDIYRARESRGRR